MLPNNDEQMSDWSAATALVDIDVQKGFNDARYWGGRNNPNCEDNIPLLMAAWRLQEWPIIFVRHDSTDELSPLRPGLPGNEFKDVITGDPDLLVVKSVHSALYGDPDMVKWLASHQIRSIAICGIQTNMCCETTARMASDQGLDVMFIIDATHTFDLQASDGTVLQARQLARTTEINLAAEFCQVVRTAELVG